MLAIRRIPQRLLFAALVVLLASPHFQLGRIGYADAAKQKQSSSSASSSSTSSSSNSVQTELQRVKNLDYLDIPAMQYYLNANTTEPYDVAVMFYAQRCSNCHALAPIWEQISRIVQAGTVNSNIIVGLFDCEADLGHAVICETVGVKHYPTLAFFSLAGNHHHLARKQPKHVSIYSANWQYGDALLDWITALSALSQWHRAGWGRRVRKALFGKSKNSQQQQQHAEPLPVGVPKAVQNEVDLEVLRTTSTETLQAAMRSSNFVDCLLFPVSVPGAPTMKEGKSNSDSNNNNTTEGEVASTEAAPTGGKEYTDVYAYLHQFGSWAAPASSLPDAILKTCASEVSLDYCQRLSTAYMEAWIEGWPSSKSITEDDFATFQGQLQQYLQQTEPFCVIMDECAVADFQLEKCQPETCPFVDTTACRYLTACLTKELQQEYAEALELLVEPEKPKEKAKTSTGFSWGL